LKAEIRSVINAAKDRGAKSQARVLLSSVRAMFSWAIDTDEYELAVSPVAAMRPKAVIGTLQPRDRALSDDELRALWSSVNAEPYPWAPMFKLLILSGQRLGDWSNASWKEIGPRTDEGGDQRCLTIPKERYKGRKHAHVVPLTARMLAILAECPRFTKGDYIFSANGHWGVTPVQNFWKPKERLDARMPADTPPWRAHDIRRTVRTNLSPLKGVEEHHREATIGHVKLGLKAVYDKWEYFDEKLDCLEKWDQRLTTILTPPDNVVRISEARARK
jgi:hypothetical protein